MLNVSREGEKILIAIDQQMISNDYFLKFLERMKLEEIANKSKLKEEDAMAIAEEIKESWWETNKDRLLSGIDD